MKIWLQVSATISLISLSALAQADGLFDRLLDRKGTAFRECKESFEFGERQKVITAASLSPGALGSTYIPSDKGAMMILCMEARGFQIAFDSLSKLNSSDLAQMSREQINAARKGDADRAAVSVDGWK